MKITVSILAMVCLAFSVALQDERTKFFPKTTEFVKEIPPPKNVMVFIMAGQSNMAGRGQVEPQDTLVNKRIFTISAEGRLVYAKEPLHFYEPARTGLDCGYAFANRMLEQLPGVNILLVPAAIGGSSISQWLGDSLYRGVKLLSNFKEKTALARQYGNICGILWHQGESDANARSIPLYRDRLKTLFATFREIAGNEKLPVLIGELGAYSKDKENWQSINREIHAYASAQTWSAVIPTGDLLHKGDTVHFNTEGQRLMGQRFADAYIKTFRVKP